MIDDESDILVKISDEHLSTLANLYENSVTWTPCTLSFLLEVIRRKKSKTYSETLDIFSPNSCWQKDGTIVVIPTSFSQDIFLFTLDETCTNLNRGLNETKRIDKSRRIFFFDVHQKFLPIVLSYIKERNLDKVLTIPSYKYALPPEDGRNLIVECPPEVYLKKLEKTAAKQINPVWPRKYPDSEGCLSQFIEHDGGWGVFLKTTNKLVAWILKHVYGHLVVLQTDEDHKRKGYATLVVKAMAKGTANEGRWSIACINHKNEASINLFEKLGFRRVEACTFIESLNMTT